MNTITKLDTLLLELEEARDNLQEEINKLALSDHHWDKFHETVMTDLDKTINTFEEFINDFDEDQSENN
jgi:phage-related tail protein